MYTPIPINVDNGRSEMDDLKLLKILKIHVNLRQTRSNTKRDSKLEVEMDEFRMLLTKDPQFPIIRLDLRLSISDRPLSTFIGIGVCMPSARGIKLKYHSWYLSQIQSFAKILAATKYLYIKAG